METTWEDADSESPTIFDLMIEDPTANLLDVQLRKSYPIDIESGKLRACSGLFEPSWACLAVRRLG